jgi:hypothetical protein
MRLRNCVAHIPWKDTEGKTNITMVRFGSKGTVDKRRVYREIRKVIQKAFNQSVSPEWIRVHVRLEYEKNTVSAWQAHQDKLDRLAWSLMNEVEDEGSTGGQECA